MTAEIFCFIILSCGNHVQKEACFRGCAGPWRETFLNQGFQTDDKKA